MCLPGKEKLRLTYMQVRTGLTHNPNIVPLGTSISRFLKDEEIFLKLKFIKKNYCDDNVQDMSCVAF